MKYQIITIPATDPIEYNIQEWRTSTIGWFKKRQVSGWRTMAHPIDVHGCTFWFDDIYPSIEAAEKSIAHLRRVVENTTARVVKTSDNDFDSAMQELDALCPGTGEFKP